MTILAHHPCAPKWTLPQGARFSAKAPSTRPGPGAYGDLSAAHLRGRPASAGGRGPRFGPPREVFLRRSMSSKVADADPEGPGLAYSGNAVATAPRVVGGVIGVYPAPPPGSDVRRGVGETPGPGEYHAPSTLKTNGAAYMGDLQSRRAVEPPREPRLPGRAELALGRSASAPAFSFGSGRRPVSAGGSGQNAPLYALPSTLGGGAASCKAGAVPPAQGRFEVRPEPGSYMPRSQGHAAPRQPFGRAARPLSAPPGGRTAGTGDHLGPGKYSVEKAPAQPAGAGLMHSGSQRSDPTGSDLAGPPGPGPGAYDLARGVGGPAIGFGRAPRDVSSSGPSTKGATAKHRMLVKAAEAAAAATEGGTAWERPMAASTLRRGPRLAPRRDPGTRGRRRDFCPAAAGGAADVPGPGAFDVEAPKDGQACIFGTGPQRSTPSTGGGAGLYDIREAAKKLHAAWHGGSFSHQGSGKSGISRKKGTGEAPGPASYRKYGSLG